MDGPRCDPDAAGPTTVRLWHSLGDSARTAFEALVERFEAEVPGVDVEVELILGGYGPARDRLRATPTEELPDVHLASVSEVRGLVDSGLFVPVEECAGGETPSVFEDLLPVIDETFRVDGALHGAPFNISAPVLMYDRLRFERAGLDPDDPPATLAEMRAASEQAVAAGEAATGLVLYDTSGGWLTEQWAAQAGLLLIEPENGRAEGPQRVTVERPEIIEWLTWASEMRRSGLLEWIGLNSSGADDLLRMVNPDQPALMTFHTSAALGDIVQLPADTFSIEFEVGVAPLPGPGSGSLAGGAGWWIVDHGDAARAGAAWRLVEWLSQPAQQAEFAAATGYVPITTSAAAHPVTVERWETQPGFEVAYRQLEAVGRSPAEVGLQVGARLEVQRELELAASRVLDLGRDPATSVRRADDDIEAVLDLYAELGEG